MAVCAKCRTKWKMSESSRCPKCSDEWRKNKTKEYDKKYRDKESNKLYQSKEWRDLRQEVIIRDGFKCVECHAPIGVRPKDHAVDHIIEVKDGGAKLDKNNLQLLCVSCHNKKGK